MKRRKGVKHYFVRQNVGQMNRKNHSFRLIIPSSLMVFNENDASRLSEDKFLHFQLSASHFAYCSVINSQNIRSEPENRLSPARFVKFLSLRIFSESSLLK